MQAFVDVLAACPVYQRARLSPSDLEPEDAMIFRVEIISLHGALAPFDPYEWSIVADIGRCAVEAARAQRTIMALVQLATRAALTEVLGSILKDLRDAALAEVVSGYLAQQPKHVARVQRALASAGLTPSVVSASARLHHEASIAQLERIVDTANKRRHRLVQDLKQTRSNQGRGRSMPVRPPDAPADRAGGNDGR